MEGDSIMAKSRKDKEWFINCQVSNGMFSNEYGVEFQLYGTFFSMFAPKESVKVKDKLPGEGLLRVWVVEKDKGLIELPAETIQQGRRYMRVKLDDLVTA
jgi:hypothetical protein